MGWLSVEYDGKWSCFDTGTDSFNRVFDERESYESWRKLMYGNLYYKPITDRNTITMKEAVDAMVFIHDHDLCIKNLLEVGLKLEDAEKLVHDAETKYVPKSEEKYGSKVYKCQNCGSTVLVGQGRCFNMDCDMKLVWR